MCDKYRYLMHCPVCNIWLAKLTRPQGFKTFSSLNSTVHKMYDIMLINVKILTFIGILNSISESLKARNVF